jgi:hypothetical protein
MSQSTAEVIKIGPAQVSYGASTNMAFMSVKGATIKWSPKTTEAKISKYGDTPVQIFYTGGSLECDFEISQTDLAVLAGLSLGIAEGTNTGGHPAAGFGMPAGTVITGQKLVITPENATYSATGSSNYSFTIWLAIPLGEPEFMYTTEGAENVYKIKFRAIYDPTHDTGGTNYLGVAAPLGLWGNVS